MKKKKVKVITMDGNDERLYDAGYLYQLFKEFTGYKIIKCERLSYPKKFGFYYQIYLEKE